LRTALESDGAFDVLGIQLRLGRRDERDEAKDDGDHHPRENAIGDHSFPFPVSEPSPPHRNA
jgi:hypothetical protein